MSQNSRTPRIDERWIRHDWRLWIQPNIERWMKPGVDPADVIPALARERAQKEAARERARAAEDAALDAEIEHARRVQAALREELNEIKAELARRRRLAEQTKYSPNQPRVPAGNPRGGQWADRSGGSGNSYDATPSTGAVTDARSEGDGTRGYDDRLAASDKPTPGRAAMLGAMARAAARAIEAYRSGNLLNDLFGNRTGAVAVTTMDDKEIFGSNSGSSTYTPQDRQDAMAMRDTLIEKYPLVMQAEDLGRTPNNGLFHAETNVLLRAARESSGTLAGRSLEIHIDRDMCRNCRSVVPLVGLELGNPNLTFVDPKWITAIHNGSILSRSKR